MPASGTREGRRGGWLLNLLFWAGVVLAPAAALLLLLTKDEGQLRIAAVLAVLAIVLIGLSITLRKNADTVRLELEETLLDEVDLLREDLRQDIATAARATHRQFSEKLQTLYGSVESLRAHLEVGRYERVDGYLAGPPPHGQLGQAHPGGPAVAHFPGGHAGTAHGAAQVGGGQLGGQPGNGYGVGGPGTAHAAGHVGSASVPGAGPVVRGVVRHTETVQVTTRHTVVDPHGDGPAARGTVYGGNGGTTYGTAGPDRGGESGTAPRGTRSANGWEEPIEESWTEKRLRERLGQWAGDRPMAEQPGAGRRSRHSPDSDEGAEESWAGRPGGTSWSSRRAGPGTIEDRWASVRTDDRGRELRLGERRAALHSDESGTELHFEDRWASVRQDEPRGRRRAEDRYREDRPGEDRHGEARHAADRPREGRHGEDRPGEDRHGEDRHGEDRYGDGRHGDGRHGDDGDGTDDWWRPPGDRWAEDHWAPELVDTGRWGERSLPAALPSASGEPSWGDWFSSRDEGRSGRRRYRDDDEDGYAWKAQQPEPQRRVRERWD